MAVAYNEEVNAYLIFFFMFVSKATNDSASVENFVKTVDLNAEERSVLQVFGASGKSFLAELSVLSRIAPTKLNAILDGLEGRGFIQMPSDNALMEIRLTENGLNAKNAILQNV
ncbi:MAG: MarR family winged helix-turn-helix transcriptional regulator [Cyanobacteria bacterium P01_H01_bin.15]